MSSHDQALYLLLQDSFPGTYVILWTNSPCRAFTLSLKLSLLFFYFYSPEGFYFQQPHSPSKLFDVSTLCFVSGNHAGICSPSFFSWHVLQPLNITSGMQAVIRCQDSPSSFIYALQLFHGPTQQRATPTAQVLIPVMQ